jgi:type II secretory pathway pseudopilin PulG
MSFFPAGAISRHRRRRGITIIEVIVVMTGVATLLGLCAVTLQLLLRLNADGQSRRAAASALERLASQFRTDVHAADTVQLVEKPDGPPAKVTNLAAPAASLRLATGSRALVTYEVRAGRVDRVESGTGRPTRHESYALDRGALVRFAHRDDGPRRFLAMIVTTRAGKEPVDPLRPLEVLALPGKDRRALARAEGGQSK